MPETRSTFQKAEELEKKWCNPPAQGDKGVQPEDWRPLPEGDYKDWAPLNDPWVMPKALRKVRNNSNIEKPLSDECAKQLSNLWEGKRVESSCGHAIKGSAHFHCYPITKDYAWKDWAKKDSASAARAIWWCSGLRNAALHYSWRKYRGGSFEQLAAALQSAIRRKDATLAAVVCLKILSWGGVRGRSDQTITWLDAALAAGTLIGDLERAASRLCPQSTAPLERDFGPAHPDLPMNSGSTKIFSAVAMDLSTGLAAPKQDVLIFDRRVSVALGLLARRLTCPRPVPADFLFPYDEAIPRRDSRCPCCAPFPRMSATTDVDRANYARIASRCMQQALGKHHPSADFVSAEKALFMIGYDVKNMCSGAHRSCPSCAAAVHPSPRKPKSRAAVPASGAGLLQARESVTLGQGVEFSYTGTPATGTDLKFGDGRRVSVSAAQYASLRAHFRGMQVAIGASRTNPRVGSLGAWLRDNLSNLPAIASYVAPILIDSGWARRINNRTIEFL